MRVEIVHYQNDNTDDYSERYALCNDAARNQHIIDVIERHLETKNFFDGFLVLTETTKHAQDLKRLLVDDRVTIESYSNILFYFRSRFTHFDHMTVILGSPMNDVGTLFDLLTFCKFVRTNLLVDFCDEHTPETQGALGIQYAEVLAAGRQRLYMLKGFRVSHTTIHNGAGALTKAARK